MEKFFNAPIDEYFNLGKVMNVPAVNVSETEKEFRLFFAVPGFKKTEHYLSKSFGYSNYYTKEKLNDSSFFELASVSKQFTAMTIK